MFLTSFIFGTLAAFFAVIFEIITLDLSQLNLTFFSLLTLLAVALIEEGSKYLFLRQYLFRYFSTLALTPRQSLWLGFSFGIGFSALETAFILLENTEMRNFWWLSGIFFIHITTTFIFVSFLKRSEERAFSAMPLPFFMAVFVHFLYDVVISKAL